MALHIYVGPNDKKLGLRQYQTFVGNYPPHVQHALKVNAGLANYFMTLAKFQTLRPPGTPVKRATALNQPARKVVRQGPPIKNLK
jgi:hypothetical protein